MANKAISVNQTELHPFLAETELTGLCHSKNIQITAYSSLASVSYNNYRHWKSFDSLPNLLDNEEIKEMAQRYDASPAQILYSWAVNSRNVAVIPKTSNVERLKENLDVLNIVLDEHDVHVLDQFDVGYRFNDKTPTWAIPIFEP